MKHIPWLALFLALSSTLSADSWQNYRKKNNWVYPGWQEEGMLKVQETLPAFPRMGTHELNQKVFQQIAWEKKCRSRQVASESEKELSCLELEQ